MFPKDSFTSCTGKGFTLHLTNWPCRTTKIPKHQLSIIFTGLYLIQRAALRSKVPIKVCINTLAPQHRNSKPLLKPFRSSSHLLAFCRFQRNWPLIWLKVIVLCNFLWLSLSWCNFPQAFQRWRPFASQKCSMPSIRTVEMACWCHCFYQCIIKGGVSACQLAFN